MCYVLGTTLSRQGTQNTADLRAEKGTGKWWHALKRGLNKVLHSLEMWLSTFLWPILIRAAVRPPHSFDIPLHTPKASGTYQRFNPRDSISTSTMMGSQGANGKRVSTLNTCKLNATGLISDLWQTHCRNTTFLENVNFGYPSCLDVSLCLVKW